MSVDILPGIASNRNIHHEWADTGSRQQHPRRGLPDQEGLPCLLPVQQPRGPPYCPRKRVSYHRLVCDQCVGPTARPCPVHWARRDTTGGSWKAELYT